MSFLYASTLARRHPLICIVVTLGRYVYQYDPNNLDNYNADPYDFPIFPWLLVFEIIYFGSTCLSVYFGIQCTPIPILKISDACLS